MKSVFVLLTAALILLTSSSPAAAQSTWAQLTFTTQPASRTDHSAVYDSQRHRMIIYGGYNDVRLGDVWSLDLAAGTWSQLSPGGTAPSPRLRHAAAYDPGNDRMLVFGGDSNAAGRNNETWSLSFAPTLTWTQLTPATSPSARSFIAAAWDSARNGMIIFGGSTGAGNVDDTWIFNGTTWSQLTSASGSPSARNSYALAYLPALDKTVLFGGTNGSALGDTWLLSGSTWTQATPAGSVTARYGSGFAVDPSNSRLILFGGFNSSGFFTNATHVFNGSGSGTWSALTTTGGVPAARVRHTCSFDPVDQKLVLFGGYTTNYVKETWTLSNASVPVSLSGFAVE